MPTRKGPFTITSVGLGSMTWSALFKPGELEGIREERRSGLDGARGVVPDVQHDRERAPRTAEQQAHILHATRTRKRRDEPHGADLALHESSLEADRLTALEAVVAKLLRLRGHFGTEQQHADDHEDTRAHEVNLRLSRKERGSESVAFCRGQGNGICSIATWERSSLRRDHPSRKLTERPFPDVRMPA